MALPAVSDSAIIEVLRAIVRAVAYGRHAGHRASEVAARQVQSRQPCSAQVPQDSIRRFFSACRARKMRTPALLAEIPRCSANVFVGVPCTSIA